VLEDEPGLTLLDRRATPEVSKATLALNKLWISLSHFFIEWCHTYQTGSYEHRKEPEMQVVNKLKMLLIVVSDMPKAKAFYADTLGLKITKDYRQDDDHWWVSLAFPDGGASMNLSTYRENVTPGTLSLYLVTSDVGAAHQALSDRGAQVSDVQDDLYGPGSGVKWFNLHDPDGNQVLVVAA